MSTDIERFEFPITGQGVRTLTVDGEHWFVHADACAILGIANTGQAATYLDDDEKRQVKSNIISSDVASGGRDPWVISESGLYSLILRSRKPEAKAFKRWITHDVLPAIRKTGSYSVVPLHEIPTSFAAALELAAKQARELEAAAPMVEQAKQHRAADGMTAVPDFANKVKAWAADRGVKVLHKDVWNFLGEIGLLIRGNTIRHNHPTAEAVRRDFVRLKESTYESTKGTKTAASPRLTPAGEGWAWDRAVKRIETTGALTRKAVQA